MTYMCEVCAEPVPHGLAHLRSIGFERVAYHGHCWDLRQAVSLPSQRRRAVRSEMSA